MEDCRSVLVVDTGFAPGYSDVVIGYAFHKLGLRDTIEIAVGEYPETCFPNKLCGNVES